jgi:hypothetical protein
MRLVGILLAVWLWAVPSWGAEFCIVQDTFRTTNGTKNFTCPSAFGTPKAAIFLAGVGATNNTATNFAGLSFGVADGTRQWTVYGWSDDNIAAGSTRNSGGAHPSRVAAFLSDSAATTRSIASFSAWITDGVTLSFDTEGTSPSTAALLTIILIGGAGVSNVYADTFETGTTVDSETNITAPNFQPDLVFLGHTNNPPTFNNFNNGTLFASVGFAHRDGTNPPPQYGMQIFDAHASNPTNVSGKIENAYAGTYAGGAPAARIELRDFDSSGFSAFLRTQAPAASVKAAYLALKLSGITAKVLPVDSPVATGSREISGIGFTPQFGMLLMSDMQAYATLNTTGDGEVLGLSAFTAAAQYSYGVWADDNVATSNTEAMVNSVPVHLRKANADFYKATFTSFSSDKATFNYSVADGTTRKWAALFVEAAVTGPGGAVRRRF